MPYISPDVVTNNITVIGHYILDLEGVIVSVFISLFVYRY